MSVLIVPELDADPWPTLGPQVCDWIEEHLVYGPGELKGEPYVIEPEFRALIYRMYEVYPQSHKNQGRRRFKRAAISSRKGTAKTEKGALIAIVESHPTGPVRCDGWDENGQPVGVRVRSPYIPLVAFSLDQTEDLAYGVARQIVEESSVAGDYDIGLERMVVLDGRGKEDGKIVPLGGSPNSRDGARTTFQYVDESHRLFLPRLKKAHQVMLMNMYKRIGADPWTLETTTSFSPGEGSVAEDTHHYAKQIEAGKVKDPRLFYFHRQASSDADMVSRKDVRAALLEASGPTASWSGDIDNLVDHWFEPNTDQAYYRRVWLNQPIAGAGAAWKKANWAACEDEDEKQPEPGELVVLGFDGARRRDAVCIYGFDVEKGHGFPLGIWQKGEHDDDDWEVPSVEVDAVIRMAFETWDVWRLYGDPPYWDDRLDAWAGEFGEERVAKWWTNRQRPMAMALQSFTSAINEGLMTHDGDPRETEHILNSYRYELNIRDEDDKPLWTIRKERADSPNKIDAAMAATLAWEARGDCITKGMPRAKKKSRKLHTFS